MSSRRQRRVYSSRFADYKWVEEKRDRGKEKERSRARGLVREKIEGPRDRADRDAGDREKAEKRWEEGREEIERRYRRDRGKV